MTKKEEKKKWETRKKLKQQERTHGSCIRVGKNESYEHAKKKFELCWELIQQGYTPVTEAKSKKGERRYDIIVLETGNIYEIESDPDIEKPDADYTIHI